jgi:acyl-coenzyme A thioesterase PaaI-like protein
MDIQIPQTLAEWNAAGAEYLPGHLGLTFLKVEPQEVVARMTARKAVGAWNGYLHAGAVVSLADTCCGYGTVRSLPPGAIASPPWSSRATSSARRARASSSASRGRCIRAAPRRCGTRA